MSNIYEFNVESLVRQQNRVLVEADSEEEARKKVRSGNWHFLYRNYTEDDEPVSDMDYDPDKDPDTIYWLGEELKDLSFLVEPIKLVRCRV